ncbi:MAG: FluC/FEX family fluoride channel, partial [Georgenia sp.]
MTADPPHGPHRGALTGGVMRRGAAAPGPGAPGAATPGPGAPGAAAPGAPAWGVRPAVLAVISLGGALGALARYGLALAWPHVSGEPPWSTVLVNVVGSLLMGVLMVVLTEVVGRPHPLARPFLGVGVLGGFTTFSTYTVDAVALVVAGRAGRGGGVG